MLSPVEKSLSAVALARVDFRARRHGGHDDRAADARVSRTPCERLRVIAGRDGHDAAGAFVFGELAQAVEYPAHLEGACLLEALALELEARRAGARGEE